MKKIIVSILSVFYLFTSTGATVHFHYCMGKLDSWNFWENTSNKCGKCGMDKKDSKSRGCCKDEHKHVKLDNDQKITASSFKLIQLTSSAVDKISFKQLPEINIVSPVKENPVSHAPPRSTNIAVFIRNCVFLI